MPDWRLRVAVTSKENKAALVTGMTTLRQLEHHSPERVFASVTLMACSEFASQLLQVEVASLVCVD
jgi:hypothetical protein